MIKLVHSTSIIASYNRIFVTIILLPLEGS